MKFEELLQCVVGWESLDAIVGYPVLRPAFRALDLPLDIIYQSLHAWFQAVGVLTWQQFGSLIPVQADAAGEQLVELLHTADQAGTTPLN